MQHVMNTYRRLPVGLVRGQGCRVWDEAGREYLDMVAGIAVCNLGHAHPEVVAALQAQAASLFHTSNLYHIPGQERLATMLVEQTFEARVFFCNSGAEANEAAIKLVRKYASDQGLRGSRIVTATGSFHGRTLATVAATGQDRFRQGFDPIPAGFLSVPYGDIEALKEALDETIAAVMLEPVQGEGGIRVPPPGYLAQVRSLCDAKGALLVFDEVQTGMGRTGELFGYRHEGVIPDLMTLAKALGNGFPMGALLARPEVAASFSPGTHASTFGGNPLAAACGIATLGVMTREDIPGFCRVQGAYLRARLEDLASAHACIREVRGRGLMLGVECDADLKDLPALGLDEGILLNVIKDHIIRLVPPLVISGPEIDRAVETLDRLLKRKGL